MGKQLFLLFSIIGTVFFMAGIHSIDAAWNLRGIYIQSGSSYYETTPSGRTMTDVETYNSGVSMTVLGFLITVASLVFYNYEPKKKIKPEVVEESLL